MDWSGVDYCDVFIRLSFWRHPFTAEHPLLRHWCRDTFLQTWWRNKLILIMHGLTVRTISANVHVWLNYCFKNTRLNKTKWCMREFCALGLKNIQREMNDLRWSTADDVVSQRLTHHTPSLTTQHESWPASKHHERERQLFKAHAWPHGFL